MKLSENIGVCVRLFALAALGGFVSVEPVLQVYDSDVQQAYSRMHGPEVNISIQYPQHTPSFGAAVDCSFWWCAVQHRMPDASVFVFRCVHEASLTQQYRLTISQLESREKGIQDVSGAETASGSAKRTS